MCKVYLGLGSNQGDRFSNIQKAIHAIESEIGEVRKSSSYYETEPWGFTDKTFFINQVIEVSTDLSPIKVLNHILLIEKHLGRNRKLTEQKYESRTIDIDILFYDNRIISEPNLQIPHPHIHERGFVLKPLNEICPSFLHPVTLESIEVLMQNCKDLHSVKKLTVKDIFEQPHAVGNSDKIIFKHQGMA